jgi:hypothetical protein
MFQVIDREHRLRPLVESTIRSAFRRDHGARLTTLPRWLVAKTDDAGVICAASLRFAEDGFFSEHYLDQPIEQLIAMHSGDHPSRAVLAEVGSLAAERPGEVREMIGGIIRFLQARGTRWAFFTATARLRTLLRRSGISLIELAPADPARIDFVETWGTYYLQDPRVVMASDEMLAATPRPVIGSIERYAHA